MTTDERLKEIRERAERATKGPWRGDVGQHEPRPLVVRAPVPVNATTDIVTVVTRHEADRDFIAHARDDVPWLLDRLEACRALIQRCADAPHGFVIAPQFAREFLEKMPRPIK